MPIPLVSQGGIKTVTQGADMQHRNMRGMMMLTRNMAATPQPARSIDRLLLRPVGWSATRDPEMPWIADVDGANWAVRLNDFPAEALYTLLIDDQPVGDFEDWPAAWRR